MLCLCGMRGCCEGFVDCCRAGIATRCSTMQRHCQPNTNEKSTEGVNCRAWQDTEVPSMQDEGVDLDKALHTPASVPREVRKVSEGSEATVAQDRKLDQELDFDRARLRELRV